ncbi:MAG: hypothetical protein ABSB99_11405 [Acidimicrobiales bacterium]
MTSWPHLAAETQLRQELEACRVEAAVASAELAHAQHELAEARRIQCEAERERAAVIAALGKRARRHLAPSAAAETPSAGSEGENESKNDKGDRVRT